MISYTEKRLEGFKEYQDSFGERFIDDEDQMKYYLVPYMLTSDTNSRESLSEIFSQKWVDDIYKMVEEKIELASNCFCE